MAYSNIKIPSLCLQCIDTLTRYFQPNGGRPMSTAIKCFRYQVCPPKKNAYQVVSKITPQLLEQIQKKSLAAGILQPGRLPHIFNSHPLTLPLVSPCGQAEALLNPKKHDRESRCYLRTSAVTYKTKKCKKSKKKKKKGGKKKKDKCGKGKKKKKKKKDKKKACKLNVGASSCPDIKMSNCKPTSSKLCTRDSIWPKCKKKCAPYPSYSEACHEDVPPPPSECRLCPWPKENHPTFKEKPRKYHTSAILRAIEEYLDGAPGPLQEMLASKCGSGDKEAECGKKVKSCKKKKKKKGKKKGKKKDKCKKKKKKGKKKGKKDECKKKKKKGKKKDKCKKKGKKGKKKGKKGKKKDKCGKKKDKKGKKKDKKGKKGCEPKWRHPPCKKDDVEHSRVCPTNLIKKPKCP